RAANRSLHRATLRCKRLRDRTSRRHDGVQQREGASDSRVEVNMTRQMMGADVIVALGVAALSIALSAQNTAKPAPTADAKPRPAMPQYNSDGALQLPGDYR